jgi:26-hydroxylase
VTLNGYQIPKNTQVIPLLHAVHMDPTLWDKPEEFRPTRFLNDEGKVTKPEYFIPFGVGKFHFLITFVLNYCLVQRM